jgi:hypothetical protein
LVGPQQISSYIRKPYSLDADAEQQLREIIKEYPYFNNAWLLLARSLHNQNNSKFQESVKQASLYGGDRALLYKLVNITEEEIEQEKTKFTATPQAENIEQPQPNIVAAPAIETQIEDKQAETTVEEATETATQTEDTIEEFGEETFANIDEIKEEVEEKIESEVAETAEEITSSVEGIGSNEEEKVKSAYEEIFGSEGKDDEDNINSEFETFDINESIEDEPILPSFDDEEEFVLQVEDNGNANIMADAIVDEGVFDIKDEEKTVQSEEPATTNREEVEEEEFALNIDETTDLETTNETNFIADNINESVSANTENIIDKVEAVENVHEYVGELQNNEVEEAEPSTTENKLQDNNIAEEVKEEAENTTSPSIENTDDISEAIAFKLTEEEPVVEENKVEAKAETSSIGDDSAYAPSTFFEWLTQLKNPEVEKASSEEKKNEIAEQPVSTNLEQSTDSSTDEPTTQESTNVDDIIERFIKVNPTISRPKAEFYNPEVKSKESDEESDDLATETLAKIYRGQNLNDKAIEVYKRLSVIYPAKAAEYKAIIAEIENE